MQSQGHINSELSCRLYIQHVISLRLERFGEGSAADACVYYHARIKDFNIPTRKYYLADVGFGACDELLVPYHNVHYHLAEWGRGCLK
jgi:hypothetical protein